MLLLESWYKRTLLLFPLGSRCTFIQTRRFRLEGQPRLTYFSLEQGIYFHDFVWNRVAKLRLFSLEQGQVLRHSAAHPHAKLKGVSPPPPPPRSLNKACPNLSIVLPTPRPPTPPSPPPPSPRSVCCSNSEVDPTFPQLQFPAYCP